MTSITPYFSGISSFENAPTVLNRATPIKSQSLPAMPSQIPGFKDLTRALAEINSLLESEETTYSSSNKLTKSFSYEEISAALQEGSIAKLLKFKKKIQKHGDNSSLILEKADLCFLKTKEAFDKQNEEFKKFQDLVTQTTKEADKLTPFTHQSNQTLGHLQELATQTKKQAANNLKLADETFKKIKEIKQELTEITNQVPRNRKAAKQAIERDNELIQCLSGIWKEKVANASFVLHESSICFSQFIKEIDEDIEAANALGIQAKEMETYVPQRIDQINTYEDLTKAIVEKALEAKENIQAKIKQIDQKRLQHLEEKITTNSQLQSQLIQYLKEKVTANSQPQSQPIQYLKEKVTANSQPQSQPQSGSGSRKGNCFYFVIKAIYKVFLKVISAFLF